MGIIFYNLTNKPIGRIETSAALLLDGYQAS